MIRIGRCGFGLPRLTGPRPILSPVECRGLATDKSSSSSQIKTLPQEPPVHTRLPVEHVAAIYRSQWELASPVDTLGRKLMWSCAYPIGVKINAEHDKPSQLPQDFELLNRLERESNGHDPGRREELSSFIQLSSFQMLVAAQIAACKTRHSLLHVLACATGPANQDHDYENFRREALQGINVQKLLVHRLTTLEKEARKRPLPRWRDEAWQRESNNHKFRLGALFCLNTAMIRLQHIGLETQLPILYKGLQISASTQTFSAFRRYFEKLFKIVSTKMGSSCHHLSRHALHLLLNSCKVPLSDAGDATARQMQEILFGSALQLSEDGHEGPPNLRSVSDLKDPRTLHVWIALLSRCNAKEQLRQEWQDFRESSFTSERDRRGLIGQFITQLCSVGDSEVAWRIFQEHGSAISPKETRVWRALLDIADAKPELTNKSLETVLESQWAEILKKDIENLERKLGLRWVSGTKEGEQASISVNGYHEFVQDDLLQFWMATLKRPRIAADDAPFSFREKRLAYLSTIKNKGKIRKKSRQGHSHPKPPKL